MFKSWRNDKKKIKAVFKLQFQATQVPPLKKPALIISLVPEDVGKTTFKLEKTPVKDGTCFWQKPLFVTVKLFKQPKTGNLKEKIYHFIVSSGSSKSGYLGESSIDFADFAEETEPITVALPLKFANSGAVLNVTVQRVQGNIDQRYGEDNGDALSQEESLKNRMSNARVDANNSSFDEDADLDDFPSHNAYQDGSFRASAGSNASIQSTPRQNSMPPGAAVDTITTKNRLHRRSSTDWSVGSASDGSLVDSTNSPEDNFPRDLRGAPDESIEKLNNEITNLMRQLDLSELELQSLRKQFTKENKKAQDLSRQNIELEDERNQLRTECIQLRSQQKSFDGEALDRLRAENKEIKVQLTEIQRELSHEKELNNNLKLQLEKTQESNSELILAVNDLDVMLEQKKLEISQLTDKLDLSRSLEEAQDKKCKCYELENEERQATLGPEESIREENESSELCLLRKKITELSDEIKLYREDREKLENYIEELTQENTDLQQENHDIFSKLEQNRLRELKMQNESNEYLATIEGLELQVQRLEEKLKSQTQKFSESLDAIGELESQIKALEKELENQAQAFENDLDATTRAKIEQEQRAIHVEEALRKTRWKNAVTAERLQDEFKRLSVEMAGKFDENEKLMMKAITEADELRLQNRTLEDRLQKANEELSLLRDQCREKAEELEDMSQKLQCAQNHQDEKQETLLEEIQTLETKMEMLNKEKNELAEHAKLRDKTEETTASLEDTEVLVERWERERAELQKNFASAKRQAEKAQEELLNLRSSKNEKDTLVEKLKSEAGSLKSQHIELKNSLSREEREKEKLQKQLLELKHELEKSMERSHSVEKEIKNSTRPDENKASLQKRGDSNLLELLTEMSLLKEKNKSMESELKEMQERYSEISLKFAEVEGERQQLVMTVRNLKSGRRN